MMDPASRDKLLENIQNDLKNISLETKKSKHLQPVRESADEAIVKIRSSVSTASGGNDNIFNVSNQILYPLVQGCETKDTKVVKLCLNLMQRLVIHKVIDFRGARYITDTLWMLMESSIEEVKILQTLTLLLTSSHVVQNETLAKCLVICFRLNFTKDPTTNTIAGATLRQLTPVVMERVAITEDQPCTLCLQHCYEEPSQAITNLTRGIFTRETNPFVIDAYLMFQDIVMLIGADQPVFMTGIVEMTRTFGLELLESLLTKFPNVFETHSQFRVLLKERVCSLVIKLFSPNIKYKAATGGGGNGGPQNLPMQEKPSYAITSKLLRVVAVLIVQYHETLTTETEIFLSLLMKFLDPDKPTWQNGSALEVIHKIVVRPQLLIFIADKFDAADHSTNVFQDMVNSIGAFVQNVMMASSPTDESAMPSSASGNTSGTAATSGSSLPYGPGSSPQPGFVYRNVWRPLTMSFIGGQTKEIYLDVADRGEPPVVSEGYCISLAYVTLLDIIRSLSILVDKDKFGSEEDKVYHETCLKQLLTSSWCGLLSALSLLLDASTDDATTDTILKHLENYASFCGKMKLVGPRDAYLASICKASLPPHYTLNVLKATPSTQKVSGPRSHAEATLGLMGVGGGGGGIADGGDIRHQVVAVGTPLPTASLPTSAHQGPVMLTAKNLQCMRSILSVAHCHGNLLGSSWHIILTTLQHLVWILGLKPVTGGVLQTSGTSSSSENNSNAVITTAVIADLPILSNMVTRLFESSSSLSDSSIKYLIDALCHLSNESMELAASNREPSLFAVAKLLETMLVNLDRVEVVWRCITSHLLIVSQHPHLRMRQWGCEAITFLTKQALQHNYTPPLHDNNRLQTLLLSPLAELSGIPYPDVRQKQLDTVLHILHASGETLNHGWPLILTMIGSLDSEHSDILVRSAFQCLQLVFTDFLPTIPYRCYPLCVDTASKFGSQRAELNVSLTAIGLLWNLSDYFFQNVTKLQEQKDASGSDQQIFPEAFLSFPGSKNISSFDKLWMCLYCKLKDLCLDSRPSVRKSSGQTLFSTIAAHGSILEAKTWQAVLWQVLFPLLDNVIIQSDNASSERVSQSQVIMIHHSRNTAQKQWCETKVLTISGVVRVFNTKKNLLRSMGDYSKAWVLLLEYVEKMSLSNTSEVSLAALKALQEMIVASSSTSETSSSSSPEHISKSELRDINWTLCWKAWLNIGTQKANYISKTNEVVLHSQVLLTGYVQIFLSLFPHIKSTFRREDVESLGNVLLSCAQIPMDTEFESSTSLTPLHTAVLEVIEAVKEAGLKESPINLAEIFDVYFKVCRASLSKSKILSSSSAASSSAAGNAASSSTSSKDVKFREKFSLLGEACLETLADFYEASANVDAVLSENILFKFVRTLHIPLRQKYRCYLQSNWRVAITILLRVLRVGIPISRDRPELFTDFWLELGSVFDSFLFPESLEEQKQEDRMADEAVDCLIIELLREEVLPHPKQVPTDFLHKVVGLLNKGSIHSSMTLSDDCSGSIGLREDFAKKCFETLLEFSLLDSTADSALNNLDSEGNNVTNRLAITSLLHRFKEVLQEAIESGQLNGNIPLQRQKTAEISFVLKAVATVIASMKKASSAANPSVSRATWNQIISLYPYLVQFTESSSPQISSSVKDALIEYHDLLQPFDFRR